MTPEKAKLVNKQEILERVQYIGVDAIEEFHPET